MISLYSLLWGFPMPILLALMLNELHSQWFKRTVQTVAYIPHFISLAVICGLIRQFSLSGGVFNDIIAFFGGTRTPLLQHPEYFRTIYVASGIWQEVGWSSIIYLAALTSVDPQLYEAAEIDGANKMQIFFKVTLPLLSPTIFFVTIMSMINILQIFDFIFLMIQRNTVAYQYSMSLVSYFYEIAFTQNIRGYASAISVVLFLIILAITAVQFVAQKYWVNYD